MQRHFSAAAITLEFSHEDLIPVMVEMQLHPITTPASTGLEATISPVNLILFLDQLANLSCFPLTLTSKIAS